MSIFEKTAVIALHSIVMIIVAPILFVAHAFIWLMCVMFTFETPQQALARKDKDRSKIVDAEKIADT